VYCILRQDFKKNVSNYILEVINQMIFWGKKVKRQTFWRFLVTIYTLLLA
jgi:hypothetical protein